MRRTLTSTVQTTTLTAQERRSFPRMRFDHPVSCRAVDGGAPFTAVGRSLSGGGVLLDSPQRLEAGTLFELRIEPALPGPPPLEAVVEVVRVTPLEGAEGWRIAGRFSHSR